MISYPEAIFQKSVLSRIESAGNWQLHRPYSCRKNLDRSIFPAGSRGILI